MEPALGAVDALTSAPQVAESLVVLTQDAALLESLHAVASSRPIAVVATEADLAVQLLSNHGAVVLIDAAAAAIPVAELTERLKTQFPDLVLVVAGGAQDQAALTAQIGHGRVYRFLHKPLSQQRVKLFVDAAWRRHGEEHEGIVGLAQTRSERGLERKRSFKGLWIAAALVAFAAGATALWMQHVTQPSPAAPAAPIATTAPPATIAPNSTMEIPPTQAALASLPPLQAAPPVVARTIKVSPTVTGADTEDKQRQLIDRLISEAHAAFAASAATEGERWMQAAREAGATEDDLDSLNREAERVRLALRAQSITRLSQQFNERLARGQLVEPDNDSAKFYLAQLRQTEADHPATRSAQEALTGRLIAEAHSFVTQQDFAAARRWLAEAGETDANAAGIASVENEITAAQRAPLKTAVSPANVTLDKIFHVDPEYPAEARKNDIGGWVDLDVFVQSDGSVSAVTVLAAQPTGLFEKAAVAAARKWRYAPVSQSVATEQHAKVRIRFELK